MKLIRFIISLFWSPKPLECDATGYVPGSKSHVLNDLHCMLQDCRSFDDIEFERMFELIESVRDQPSTGTKLSNPESGNGWKCPKCGSEEVHAQLWVHLNTDAIMGETGNYDWCDECDEEIKVTC